MHQYDPSDMSILTPKTKQTAKNHQQQMKTLMQKKFNYQKRDNSKSIDKIDYNERTDPVLRYKESKKKYKGLMNYDFSMAKDF